MTVPIWLIAYVLGVITIPALIMLVTFIGSREGE